MPFKHSTQTQVPKIKISRLRDIGWSIWDPIGLMPAQKCWQDKECQPFADEYDNYLVAAAGKLRRGASDVEVASYLVQVESQYMGMDSSNKSLERATQVVAAIKADKNIWS